MTIVIVASIALMWLLEEWGQRRCRRAAVERSGSGRWLVAERKGLGKNR